MLLHVQVPVFIVCVKSSFELYFDTGSKCCSAIWKRGNNLQSVTHKQLGCKVCMALKEEACLFNSEGDIENTHVVELCLYWTPVASCLTLYVYIYLIEFLFELFFIYTINSKLSMSYYFIYIVLFKTLDQHTKLNLKWNLSGKSFWFVPSQLWLGLEVVLLLYSH